MFEAAELDQRVSKQEFEERVPVLRASLLDAQRLLAESDFAVVIVIAGAEGAGKGEVINSISEWLDTHGLEVHALDTTSSEENERPVLFRFWRRLPARGRTAVFFGSWYTLPIVERALDQSDEDHFDHELERIVEYERMLARENIVLVKLWLHISKKRQKKVFKKLESDPDTAWRVGERDWEFHETYDAFVAAAGRALRETDKAHARWNVINARDRRHRDLTSGQILLGAIEERLNAPPPTPAGPETPPVPPRVNVINSLDLSLRLEREEYDERLSSAQGRLGNLARRLTASQRAAVIVFEGTDAAGKGGCIRRITRALDARWYGVIPVAAPTDEELAHPYLWRFWRQVPAGGRFAIYDRSWYGRVLVERVEGFASRHEWQRAFGEINEFEEQLTEGGIQVFKFWLATSPEEQLRRFEDRRATPYKQYKITPDDWRNREKWLAYEAAACDMIERTSTEFAPWKLVSAEDKRHARVTVLETLCQGLEAVLERKKKSER